MLRRASTTSADSSTPDRYTPTSAGSATTTTTPATATTPSTTPASSRHSASAAGAFLHTFGKPHFASCRRRIVHAFLDDRERYERFHK